MGVFEFLTVAVVFSFIGSTVKMALNHAERIARIKYESKTIEVNDTHFIEDETNGNNRY